MTVFEYLMLRSLAEFFMILFLRFLVSCSTPIKWPYTLREMNSDCLKGAGRLIGVKTIKSLHWDFDYWLPNKGVAI